MAITLKAARVNAGLSQKEAAALIEVSPDTISNWENYKSYPDALFIKKIEEIYNVPFKDIIFSANSSV